MPTRVFSLVGLHLRYFFNFGVPDTRFPQLKTSGGTSVFLILVYLNSKLLAEEWEPGYKRKFYDTFAGFGFRDFASDVAQVVERSKLSVKARRHGSPSFGTADDSDSSVVQSNEDDQLVV